MVNTHYTQFVTGILKQNVINKKEEEKHSPRQESNQTEQMSFISITHVCIAQKYHQVHNLK